jgi:hypothetical protein
MLEPVLEQVRGRPACADPQTRMHLIEKNVAAEVAQKVGLRAG